MPEQTMNDILVAALAGIEKNIRSTPTNKSGDTTGTALSPDTLGTVSTTYGSKGCSSCRGRR
jgi:hypothetical protein